MTSWVITKQSRAAPLALSFVVYCVRLWNGAAEPFHHNHTNSDWDSGMGGARAVQQEVWADLCHSLSKHEAWRYDESQRRWWSQNDGRHFANARFFHLNQRETGLLSSCALARRMIYGHVFLSVSVGVWGASIQCVSGTWHFFFFWDFSPNKSFFLSRQWHISTT